MRLHIAGVSPLSPVLKSLLADNEPAAVLHRGRESLMRRIESRFRFLAVRLLRKFPLQAQLESARHCSAVMAARAQLPLMGRAFICMD